MTTERAPSAAAGETETTGPRLCQARAAVAETAVRVRHLRRVWWLPGTTLGVAGWPSVPNQRLHGHWNYWWQAHLLDCLVDAQLRAPSPERARLIGRLVRGVRLRNLGSWTNDYYDDIAWLGLALLRASAATGIAVDEAVTPIVEQLRAGWTDHAGGGVWWRRRDTFKNVPANGPAAILLARWSRAGGERADLQRARSITQWMESTLVDPNTGLLWDGLYTDADGAVGEIVTTVYTYCQGVFLGACLELAPGDTSGVWLQRAERTVDAVAAGVARDGVLVGQGGGDGGLFAGILARYLALAALVMPTLGAVGAGGLAANLVRSSADAAWHSRAVARGGPLFGPSWDIPAAVPASRRDVGAERDLSVQLSGWMVLEAAALLERSRR